MFTFERRVLGYTVLMLLHSLVYFIRTQYGWGIFLTGLVIAPLLIMFGMAWGAERHYCREKQDERDYY